uniref:Uncharacterized protein n=1 Tax=Ixodes ricinus TaxID=34613 RepID=V5IJJ6_IXORI
MEVHARRMSAAYQNPRRTSSSNAASAPISPGISVESSITWFSIIVNNNLSASTAQNPFPKGKTWDATPRFTSQKKLSSVNCVLQNSGKIAIWSVTFKRTRVKTISDVGNASKCSLK